MKILLPRASELRQPRLPRGSNLRSRLALFERRKRRAVYEQSKIIVNFPCARIKPIDLVSDLYARCHGAKRPAICDKDVHTIAFFVGEF